MITSTRSQTFGGNGGSSFDDTHDIDAWGRVTQIIVRHGSEVDSLGIFWANGNFSIRGGTGGTQTVIILDPDEFISRVDGRSGDRLDQNQLSFKQEDVRPLWWRGRLAFHRRLLGQGAALFVWPLGI